MTRIADERQDDGRDSASAASGGAEGRAVAEAELEDEETEMSDRNVCPKCGGWKCELARECRNCWYERERVEQVPTENFDFIREAFEALVRACRGQIS